MIFRGTATALITPFHQGKPDLEAFARLVEYQIESGIEALVVLGTTGEAATMTAEDKEAVARKAFDVVAGRVPVILGCGDNSTARTLAATRHAFDLGADGALVVTPYYNKPTQEGLKAHYQALDADGAGPIIAYHVPGRTGGSLSAETVAFLANHCPNLVGLKDATGDGFFADQICAYTKAVRPDFALYSGNDDSAFHLVCGGGDGLISVMSNLAPELTGDMVRATLAGDLARGRTLHHQLLGLSKSLFLESNPGPVKWGAKLLGFGDGSLALPLVPPCEAVRHAVEADLCELGLL